MNSTIETFENKLREFIKGEFFPYQNELSSFVFSPSKRLRPKLIETVLKASNTKIQNIHFDLMIAIELLHSATLVHDDIIDEDKIRRGRETLSSKFGTKVGVLLGDFLLSLTLKKITEINSLKILNMYSKAISNILKGELTQLKALGEIKTEEEYLEKSKFKTGELFLLGVNSAFEFSNIKEKEKEMLREFTQYFGIAYQIKNDLINYKYSQSDKKLKNYTLPYILLKQHNKKYDIIEMCEKRIENFENMARKSIKNIENKEELENFLGYLH